MLLFSHHSLERPEPIPVQTLLQKKNMNMYPLSFFTPVTMDPSEFPLHKLEVNTGAPLMLVRNIDPNHGLYNGTCMIVMRSTQRVLQCCVAKEK